MALSVVSRLKNALNVFMQGERDPPVIYRDIGPSYSYRPDRPRLSRGNERSIVTSIYNRIAMDVSSIDIRHIMCDDNGRYKETMDSPLNNCLSLEPNLDQTAQAFFMDVVLSMLDEGVVAIIPVVFDRDIYENDAFDIYSVRTGKIVGWYPKYVRVRTYDERDGRQKEIIVPKEATAIIENPLYAVINEPNSTMQRLIRKLNILDAIDEQSGSGKLDLIIKLPYTVKSPLRQQQAENRREDIASQLEGSKYGIAYIDSTENITQLNRPVENNLMGQIEYLTSMLYSQLGFSQAILDGSADDKTMLNYYSRIIEPILSAITKELTRKFLTQNARTRGQTVSFFRDPFKLVPVSSIAEIADKFTRNEIMTSNEIRQIIGIKPSEDPNADKLINKNINHPGEGEDGSLPSYGSETSEGSGGGDYDAIVNELLDSLEASIDEIIGGVEGEPEEEEEDGS